jgi:aminoglycoside 6-adenylyltransferase
LLLLKHTSHGGGPVMKVTAIENEVIHRLVHWADRQASIRAMLLTSSRAVPNAPLDAFSDYDIVLVVTEVHPFYADDSWLEDFGRVLVVYRDPLRLEYGLEQFGRVTFYEDGTKIDYTVLAVAWLRRILEDSRLPDELDAGYAVLLDKDHVTVRLGPPTYTAYIPSPPTETEYRAAIEEFWSEAPYVAKNLWRDELIFAKYNLEYVMKFEKLRQMLEWRMEIDHDWSVKPGVYGRGLKKRLNSEIWSELETTFVGAGTEENWQALFNTIELFRKVAIEVGDHLGFAYPLDLDQRVMQYLRKVKNLDRGAETF